VLFALADSDDEGAPPPPPDEWEEPAYSREYSGNALFGGGPKPFKPPGAAGAVSAVCPVWWLVAACRLCWKWSVRCSASCLAGGLGAIPEGKKSAAAPAKKA
jgi:hypothetical protein